jgi:N-acetylmuramoyl-L-alanine amidase
MKHTWLIDAGHGGFMEGEYVTAPAKMYEHSPEEIFYEGVFNRQIKDALLRELWRNDIAAIDTCATELDLPLSVRVNIINSIYQKYENAVLISLHSNAGGGTGFEVWTSYGQTRSDKFAGILFSQFSLDFPDVKMRKDTSDGDVDKEDAFYILKNSHCPAVLPECLFYDNYEDYKMLDDPDFRIRYVSTLLEFIKQAENENI